MRKYSWLAVDGVPEYGPAPAHPADRCPPLLDETGDVVCGRVQVLGSTVLVLALVGSSAFLLLGLNSVLSSASTAIFD